MTDLVSRQEQLEYEQVALGAQHYRGVQMPWQEGAPAEQDMSDGAPGRTLTMAYLEPLAGAIVAFMQGCADGEAGRKHGAYPYLLHVQPEQAAYLALRVTLNAASGRKGLATAAEQVALAVEDHINFMRMRDQNPGLYRLTLSHLLRYREPRRRREVMARQVKKYAIENLSWSTAERVLLGTKLIELVEFVTGLVKVTMYTEGKHRRRQRVEFTPEAEAWVQSADDKAALLAPLHMPMLVPPRPWTTPLDGGYLTGAIRAWLVRVKRKETLGDYEGVDMPEVYAAVNRVQSTAWRINGPVYDLMRDVMAAGGTLGGLPATDDAPMPTRPVWLAEGLTEAGMTVDQIEEFRVWKAQCARTHQDNAKRRADRVTLARRLHLAGRFREEDALYFPCYLDFRSRIYPFCDALSFQGDDATKALLEFAEGKPLGETGGYWLAVHLANCFAIDGTDKLPFDERVRWVRDNEEAILDSAFNPLDGARFWAQAENPWCALAACMEWAGFLVQGNDYVSHLPVNMDGSCSGLQHYSALLRDPVGGAAVNLVPSDRAADIYTQVANRAQAIVDSSDDATLAPWKGGKVVRKVVKQPCMTMCYSATKYGMRGQIENALRKLDEDGEKHVEGDNFRNALALADVVWDAIGDVVVAARQGMDFLKGCARVVSSAGLPVRWTAPNGFVVSQAYVEEIGEFVKVHYNGAAMQITVVRDGVAPDPRRNAAGIAPNYVHALDSSHLMATVNMGSALGISSWCVIHDSFGCHAGDVGLLGDVIRATFVRQYETDRLAQFRAEVVEAVLAAAPELVGDIPPVPEAGSLDLEAVMGSEFFFA